MTMDNDNTEYQQGVCANKLQLSVQERSKSQFSMKVASHISVKSYGNWYCFEYGKMATSMP